mmetsp:Transcript_29473/g.44710  ORF Transcript_29473/g.44710 Transcript_29473/m.44710 type:complete len:223 (+) Transcript_29473:424-1092(+)
MSGEESLTEARGESGDGLSDSHFGTGNLGSVSTDEMVHGLVEGQLGDGREDTVSIAGKEDNVLGMSTLGRQLNSLDVLQRIAASGVLSHVDVIVVDGSGLSGEVLDVLHDGTELDGVVDIGLILLGEANGLGVAAALNVENSIIAPHVLVISQQGSVGISREGSLSSSRETEQESGVTVLSFVGRGVHGKSSHLGHQVVHDTEDTLLHLTSVLGAEDNHLAV